MFFRSLENSAKCFGAGLLATRMQQEFPLNPGVWWRKLLAPLSQTKRKKPPDSTAWNALLSVFVCVFENILQHLALCHSSLGYIFPMRLASVLLCLGEHNPRSKLLHICDYVILSAKREGGQRRGEWGAGGKRVHFVCKVLVQHRQNRLLTVSDRRREARIQVKQQTRTMAAGIEEVCPLCCFHQP